VALAPAADAEYKRVLVNVERAAVEVRLPLTDVSGAARVKQRDASGFGNPIAPTKLPLDDACYIEWQISYDTTAERHWSLAPGVKFEREGRNKFGCELSKMLVEARALGILTDGQIRRELDDLAQIGEGTLEAHERIVRVAESDTLPGQDARGEFTRFVQKMPEYIRDGAHGRIEIQLKQKQRAVGYQAMVYVCLPLATWRREDGTPRGPGAARTKETVIVRFDKESADFLLDVVRAFGIASAEHNSDMRKILACVLEPRP
jgi:hypothetical protein